MNKGEGIDIAILHLAKEENKCIIIVTHSKNVASHVDEVFELKKQD